MQCKWVGLLVIGLALGLSPRPLRAQTADQAALRQGVTEIAAPGLPGPVAVFGPHALAVVVGRSGKGLAAPVVAASRLGQGRVVAFGHPGYLDKDALETADTGVLILNAVRWLARAWTDAARRRSGSARPSRFPACASGRRRRAGWGGVDRPAEE